jgi:hypothetical protein
MRQTIAGATIAAAALCALLIGASHLPVARPGAGGRAPALPLASARKRPATHPTGPRPDRGTWLAIAYLGNGLGEVEPCG